MGQVLINILRHPYCMDGRYLRSVSRDLYHYKVPSTTHCASAPRAKIGPSQKNFECKHADAEPGRHCTVPLQYNSNQQARTAPRALKMLTKSFGDTHFAFYCIRGLERAELREVRVYTLLSSAYR